MIHADDPRALSARPPQRIHQRAIALMISGSLALGGCQSSGLGPAQTSSQGQDQNGNTPTASTQNSIWTPCIVGAVVGAIGFTVYTKYMARKAGASQLSPADQKKILAAVIVAGCAIPAAATAIGNALKNDADRARHEDAFARAAARASESEEAERKTIMTKYEKRAPSRNPAEQRRRDEELRRQLDKLSPKPVEETWSTETGTGGVEVGGPVKDPSTGGQECRHVKEYVRAKDGQSVQSKVWACRKGPGEQYVRVDPAIMQG